LLQKQQTLLDINYDGSNYFSNLNWPEIYFWKNDVFTKFVLDNHGNGSQKILRKIYGPMQNPDGT